MVISQWGYGVGNEIHDEIWRNVVQYEVAFNDSILHSVRKGGEVQKQGRRGGLQGNAFGVSFIDAQIDSVNRLSMTQARSNLRTFMAVQCP